MAESQVAYEYDEAILDSLNASLSQPRLAPYYAAANGDRALAIKLYLWNSRVAKAFLFPLQIAEVVTRNSIHRALSKSNGGPSWITKPALSLTQKSRESWEYTVRRLNDTKGNTWGADDLVAALSFDFWSNLFRVDYELMWSTQGLLVSVFPNLDPIAGRRDVQIVVKEVNAIRNRIAHHEPIHKIAKPEEKFESVLQLIGWSCLNTRQWVSKHSTVLQTIPSKPNRVSTLPGRPIGLMNLRPPRIVKPDASLQATMKDLLTLRPPIILVPCPAGSPLHFRVLLLSDFLSFVSASAMEFGGMVDLSAFTVDHVIGHAKLHPFGVMSKLGTTGDVLAAFFPPKTREEQRPAVLLVIDQSQPAKIVGLIAHPEVRY